MINAVAFDIYGTLIDTQAVLGKLTAEAGERAEAISRLWRQKQLEYSFRRGLMRDYRDFSICTRDALVYASRENGLSFDEATIERLMQAYADLDAFPEAKTALYKLRDSGRGLYAFSNGSQDTVERLLHRAGIHEVFSAVVSVEAVRTFKPAPEVYAHLGQVCAEPAERICLVSGNPFDVLGAAHAGLRTAWLHRDPATQFDPWGAEPDIILGSLDELPARLGTDTL